MYATTSALSQLATTFSDAGLIVAAVVVGVLAGVVALLGLGFGVRRVRGYITGPSFMDDMQAGNMDD